MTTSSSSNAGLPHQLRASLLQNWISLVGAVVSASGFFSAVCLLAIDLFAEQTNPYLGILTYMVAPGVMMTGFALIGLGMLWERRRRLATPGDAGFPRIDLNEAGQRRKFVLVMTTVFVFLMLSALGSYRTYHFTESVQFCGMTCHEVMKPEHTTYQNSPHARVACVECHIGSGAGWFVRSKLSGSYQVYSVLAHKYPKPIPTPVKNLRPAQDTCEACHWPQKFTGSVERINPHFLADETNTAWAIRLLMKVGGGNPQQGPIGGIHWHVSGQQKIDYIATDEARQKIPWVRVTGADGKTTVYQAKEGGLKTEDVSKFAARRMDCIDCHNRPAHGYRTPSRSVNEAIAAGQISQTLPFIKKNAVEVLTGSYETTTEALNKIEATLSEQYKSFANHTLVSQAITEVKKIYSNNFFPEMKADWRRYPSNIGHTVFPGCYRCHDGQHVSSEGKPIRHDCNLCHTILSQGQGEQLTRLSAKGDEFQHPSDIGDLWKEKESNCTDCHNGALVK